MKKILVFLISFLLLPSLSYAGKWHTNMKKQEKKDFSNYVLRAQSKNKMVFTIRNVPKRPGLIKFFDRIEDHMGVAEKGIEFNLSYSDVGDKNDWSRWGKPGFAQRYQIMEPYKQTTKKGKTKWYRVGYFIPNEVDTEKHTISLFDFKMLYGKGEKAVGPAYNFNNNRFGWMFNAPNYRVTKNEGGEAYFFDSYVVDLDQKFSPLKGKWVNILINAKWAKDGFLHLWIDGKLRSSYFGDVLGGATSVRFKFGPYRNYMTDATDAGLKIEDATIRYSNVGKADSCDELWSGCDEITGQLKSQSQVDGIIDVSFCKPADADKSASCESFKYRKGSPAPF
jgi:hypothetical protein